MNVLDKTTQGQGHQRHLYVKIKGPLTPFIVRNATSLSIDEIFELFSLMRR